MILLMLILGTVAVFSAGALFNSFLNGKTRSDLYSSLVALAVGLFILISMIGALV
jgi:hypothetical protein